MITDIYSLFKSYEMMGLLQVMQCRKSLLKVAEKGSIASETGFPLTHMHSPAVLAEAFATAGPTHDHH